MLRRAAAAAYFVVAMPAAGQVATSSPGVEYALVALPGDQTAPAISSSYVPFTDLGVTPSRIGVFLFAGPLGYVPGGSGARHDPAVVAPVLAFVEDGPPAQIWTYDLVGGALVQVSPSPADQEHPTVGTNLLAWEDARGNGPHIWVKDLVQGTEYRLAGTGTQIRPRASGRRIVYVDVGAGSAVKLYDADSSTTTTIFAGPAAAADIDGSVVAVAAGSPDLDVMLFTAAGAASGRLALPGDQTNPRVSQSMVAFEDLSTGTSRAIIWDFGSARLLAPPPGTSSQVLGALESPRMVYADDRSGSYDIYLYDPTGATPPPPPPSDGGVDGGTSADGGGGGDGGVCQRRCHRHGHGEGDDCEDEGDGWRRGGTDGRGRADGRSGSGADDCDRGDDCDCRDREDCDGGDECRAGDGTDGGDDGCRRPAFPVADAGPSVPDAAPGVGSGGGSGSAPSFPAGCGGGLAGTLAVALAGLLPRRRRARRG